MHNQDGEGQNEIWIDGEKIEEVDEDTYLGGTNSFKDKSGKEIREMIKKAWGSFLDLKQIFNGDMSVKSKIKILKSCVVPVLVHEAQTWALTNEQSEELRVTQKQMERSIQGIKKRDRVKY